MPTAVMVVKVEAKCARLVTESTTTITVSCPEDSGSSNMKSTLMVSQAESGIGRGEVLLPAGVAGFWS